MLGCPLRFPRKNDIRSVLYLLLLVRVVTSYLRYLCLLAYSGVQHILCFVFVLFVFVLSTLCSQFLWIVHLWLHLRNSLMFIMLNYRSLLLLNSIIEVTKYFLLILDVLFIVHAICTRRFKCHNCNMFYWYLILRPLISLDIKN